MVKHILLGVIVACALAAPACSSDDGTPSTLPIAPSVTPTVENFSGTVQVGSFDAHPFTVVLSGGLLSATLTAVGPPATIFMGFGVGAWDGTTCTLLAGGSINTPAGTTPQLSGNVNQGNYCLMVYDIGNQTGPVSYSWTVSHY